MHPPRVIYPLGSAGEAREGGGEGRPIVKGFCVHSSFSSPPAHHDAGVGVGEGRGEVSQQTLSSAGRGSNIAPKSIKA